MIFDLCNSTTPFAKGFKSPITQYNFMLKCNVIADAIRYIKSLTDAAGKPLVQCKRKTGFVGFVVTLTSIQRIAERLLRNGYKILLTYRLSQDHQETLFSRIRRKGGWNNTPNTPVQIRPKVSANEKRRPFIIERKLQSHTP